jgi:hypothetical protein
MATSIDDFTAVRQARTIDWPRWMLVTAVPLAIIARLSAGLTLPLWFDEAFTGTIASQRTFAGLVHWCLTELTGPVFYMGMWAWAHIAGLNDNALRLLPFFMSFAAPALIAWRGHRDSLVRHFWATACLLWLPMLAMASEARAYPQLFLLATFQAILFVRLIERGERGLAWWWSLATALTILTHYYALLTSALQGIVILFSQRHQLKRMLPAAVPLLVAAVWIVVHLRFLVPFAAGMMTSYNPVPPAALALLAVWILGMGPQAWIVPGALIITYKRWRASALKPTPEALLVWCGVGAILLLAVSSLFRPTLMPRYFTPAMPALLFGLGLWSARLWRSATLPVAAVYASLFAAMLIAIVAGPNDIRFRERRWFTLERATDWLREGRPERLYFLWSTPVGAISVKDDGAENLRQVAAFGFQRKGSPVAVRLVTGVGDPNRRLADAAAGDGKGAILWLSDNRLPVGVHPMLDHVDPRWSCRDFGGEGILVYACRPRS